MVYKERYPNFISFHYYTPNTNHSPHQNLCLLQQQLNLLHQPPLNYYKVLYFSQKYFHPLKTKYPSKPLKKKMKNKRIHPSPLPSSSSLAFLSCLPTALLALASTLSPQEQEVLSYLLDSEKPKTKKAEKKQQKSHAPNLDCSCFGCYKSFWAVWDSSPNRQVIHLILDEYEARLEGKNLIKSGSKGKSKKKKSSLKKSNGKGLDFEKGAEADVKKDDGGNEGYFDDVYEKEEEEEKGSIRKFMGWVFGIN